MTCGKELELHKYYGVGKVYPFTVLFCYPAYKADGTQQTRYIIKDKRGDKHTFYCDCTRYKPNQKIHLKVREISYGGLKFESNVIESLEGIFETGTEYEFEVINYQAGRYVVCDRIIGKNHYLSSDDKKLYEKREILKLEVQGFDDKGCLLLVDRNPPKPTGPMVNGLQVLAENQAKEQKSQSPQVVKHQQTPDSFRKRRRNRQYSNNPPNVAPSIAMLREDNRGLVQDYGDSLPGKETSVKRVAKTGGVYTGTEKTPHAGGKQCIGLKSVLPGFAEKVDSESQRQKNKKNQVKDIARETEQREAQGTENEQKVEESVSAPSSAPVPGVEVIPKKDSIQHPVTGELVSEMLRNGAAEVPSLEELAAKEEPSAGERKELAEAEHIGESAQTEISLAGEDSGDEVSVQEPLVEPPHELQIVESEAESYSDLEERIEQELIVQKDAIFYPFITWMDDVHGMEKPVELIVKSGQVKVIAAIEYPDYQRQDVDEPKLLVVQKKSEPCYVRLWQYVKDRCKRFIDEIFRPWI